LVVLPRLHLVELVVAALDLLDHQMEMEQLQMLILVVAAELPVEILAVEMVVMVVLVSSSLLIPQHK
jgi:hypothetical protein